MMEYPYGDDYEFLCVDACGFVARFTTAGLGPIPQRILDNFETNDNALDLIYTLPYVSHDAQVLVDMIWPDDFLKIAKLGIYGYDWSDVHKSRDSKTNMYEPISIPRKPMIARSFPSSIQSALKLVILPDVEFSSNSFVSIRSLGKCEFP